MIESWNLSFQFIVSLLLVVIGILGVVTATKVIFLLHNVNDFVQYARYEVIPMMRDLKNTAKNVESMTRRTERGVDQIEKGILSIAPPIQEGVSRLKTFSTQAVGLSSILVSGIKSVFRK